MKYIDENGNVVRCHNRVLGNPPETRVAGRLGGKWMYLEEACKFVRKKDIQAYLDQGWKFGRTHYKRKKRTIYRQGSKTTDLEKAVMDAIIAVYTGKVVCSLDDAIRELQQRMDICDSNEYKWLVDLNRSCKDEDYKSKIASEITGVTSYEELKNVLSKYVVYTKEQTDSTHRKISTKHYLSALALSKEKADSRNLSKLYSSF